MASYITIEKDYIEKLLRRAEYNSSSSNPNAAPSIETVTILKSEYDDMIRKCAEYANLRRALYRGGVEHSSLETLIRAPEDQDGTTATNVVPMMNGPFLGTPVMSPRSKEPASYRSQQMSSGKASRTVTETSLNRQSSVDYDEIPFPSDDKADSAISSDGPAKQHANGAGNRTIMLKNVPEQANHGDIAAAVRGGALVDLFLRSRDRLANVSFADPKSAQEFYTYAKRVNLRILGQLIDVSWSDRQYTLSSYITSQISNGASRNLIIRGVHPSLTNAMIREDMKHIHNLIIFSIKYDQGNAYISTNSVQKASFARNCMMSRMPYRIMRIEYYPDECAEPLPRVQDTPKRETSRTTNPLNPQANRFQMLNLEETDDDSDGSDDMSGGSPLGGGIHRRNNSSLAA